MTDIAGLLLKAEKELRTASDSICNATMTEQELSTLTESLQNAINSLIEGIKWVNERRK